MAPAIARARCGLRVAGFEGTVGEVSNRSGCGACATRNPQLETPLRRHIVCFASEATMDEQVQSSQSDTDQGKSVYCIIKTDVPRDFGSVGIGGRGDRVYTVHYKEFGAV